MERDYPFWDVFFPCARIAVWHLWKMKDPEVSNQRDGDRLKTLRMSVAQHFEDCAFLHQQLPPVEHQLFLRSAVEAWELAANEPLTSEKLQGMIEAIFSPPDDGNDGNDTEEPISATGGEAA
jgi:hypothetical protein